MFESFIVIFSLAALFSIINFKFLKLPTTIGLMILALITGLIIIASQNVFPNTYNFFCRVVQDAKFESTLLDVMLSFLLFAGAMHVNIHELAKEKIPVLLFATISTLITTFLVGGAFFVACKMMGIELPFLHALLFGALIAPTDPIAVLSILKSTNVGESLQLKIEGESLFNDGVGVVIFVTVLSTIKMSGEGFSIVHVLQEFGKEALGGMLYGLLLGYLGYLLIKWVDGDAKTSMMITLMFATGGYALAALMNVSGPLAMVVSGLMIGNQITKPDFSPRSQDILLVVWEMLDDILNAILFVLIGLVVHTLEFKMEYFIAAGLAIVIVLFSRMIAVGLPYSLLKHEETDPRKTIVMLTWGGLRGGLSVALALTIVGVESKDFIVFVTYIVVVFSIIVQGLSIGKVVKFLKI